jgi:hypothetical protein
MSAMPAPIQIDGLEGWWQAVPQRYDITNDPLHCPVCGGIGIPWAGWYHCDGTCHAKALVGTGQVFVPVAPPVLPETYCWEP